MTAWEYFDKHPYLAGIWWTLFMIFTWPLAYIAIEGWRDKVRLTTGAISEKWMKNITDKMMVAAANAIEVARMMNENKETKKEVTP